MSIAYVDDETIRRLNSKYLGRGNATDVLAFDLSDGPEGDGEAGLLGEVIVSAERAAGEAERRGISPVDEVALYTVHGLLHLLGFDDATPAAAEDMYAQADAALEAAGFRPVARAGGED